MTTPHVTVPVEPTEAMIEAAEKAADDKPTNGWGNLVDLTPAETWAAMLSAAPAPEGGAVLDERGTDRVIEIIYRHVGADHRGNLYGVDEAASEINAIRAQPPAREDAQPVAPWGHAVKFGANGWGFADDEDPDTIDARKADPEYQVLELFTHPAPDALRVAVEAIIERVKSGASGTTVQALGALSDIEQIALAALQAEQGAK
nr:hypothetical protein [Brevundimonas diminuta]